MGLVLQLEFQLPRANMCHHSEACISDNERAKLHWIAELYDL